MISPGSPGLSAANCFMCKVFFAWDGSAVRSGPRIKSGITRGDNNNILRPESRKSWLEQRLQLFESLRVLQLNLFETFPYSHNKEASKGPAVK